MSVAARRCTDLWQKPVLTRCSVRPNETASADDIMRRAHACYGLKPCPIRAMKQPIKNPARAWLGGAIQIDDGLSPSIPLY